MPTRDNSAILSAPGTLFDVYNRALTGGHCCRIFLDAKLCDRLPAER